MERRYCAIFSKEQVCLQVTIKPERSLEAFAERLWSGGFRLTLLASHCHGRIVGLIVQPLSL